ncbi:biosynthetic arginine decarboxylase [Planctomycetes bacterium Pan216]
MDRWDIGQAEDLYAVRQWGRNYFSINDDGNVAVHPTGQFDQSLDLRALIDRLALDGIHPPLLLRFSDILRHRIGELHQAFAGAIDAFGYRSDYRSVYPIKVNQQRHVVEEIYDHGKAFGCGLEAGSKPELLAILALVDRQDTPIICNGFKDAEYIEAVVLAQKMGRTVLPVIEKVRELHLLVEHAARHSIRPAMGVRVKLATRGAGRWESSSGQMAKFGLTISELVDAVEFLKSRDLADQLRMLHFHVGSQITNIRNIKEAVNEAARIYVELSRAGAGLGYLDVGGGLGVDYDGSQTQFGSSINYTLQEYANDVVYGIQSICDEAKVEHPTIITESGRAITAYYSVLVFNVLGVESMAGQPMDCASVSDSLGERPSGEQPAPIATLYDTLADLSAKNVHEMYHDAIKSRDDAMNLFSLGYLTLNQRGLADRIFWEVCRRIQKIIQRMDHIPEDLEVLESMLADTYFCNFSVFQSMPDAWAVQQLFPVVPLQRHREEPTRRGRLADITCDSDGKLDRFIDLRDVKQCLELHAPNGEEYYLGAFLVGAYQEILGDMHNLFGDTHAVQVRLGEDNEAVIENVVKGNTVRDMLAYVQFSCDELLESFRVEVEKGRASGQLTDVEADRLIEFYASGLDGYTYLE